MEKIDEEKYRQLLIRMIGAKMQKLVMVDKNNLSNLYNAVYESFASGIVGDIGVLNSIRKHRRDISSPCPVYGYFNLNTLYSFHRFIDGFIRGIAKCYNDNNAVSMDNFYKLLRSNKQFFVENRKTRLSAWYSAYEPISIAKNEKGYNPMKPISPSEYLKRYSKANEDLYDVNIRLLRELDNIIENQHINDGKPPKPAKEELQQRLERKEFCGVNFDLIGNVESYTHEEPFSLVFHKKYCNQEYGVIDIFTSLSSNDSLGIYEIKKDDDRYLKGVGNYQKIILNQPIAYYPNKNGELNSEFTERFKENYGENSIKPHNMFETYGSTTRMDEIPSDNPVEKSKDTNVSTQKTIKQPDSSNKFGEPTTGGDQIRFF